MLVVLGQFMTKIFYKVLKGTALLRRLFYTLFVLDFSSFRYSEGDMPLIFRKRRLK